MTALAAPVAPVERPHRPRPTRAPVPPVPVHLAVTLVTVGWWLVAVPREWGGRDAAAVSVGALLIAACVAVVRPHRVLPRAATALSVALSAAALLVAVAAPTGWAGAPTAASYVCLAWLVPVVAAVVRRDCAAGRWLVAAVAGSAAVELAEGWLAWWGGQDPSAPMIGTFFWHDPFAAFLLPGALLGLWLWVRCTRTVALVGLVALTLGTVGVVYSTSRAALACLALGAGAMAVGLLLPAGRRRALARLAVAGGVAAGVTYALAGPPFFAHRSAVTAGLEQRAAGQPLGQNGGYRLQFLHEAWRVFASHPLVGGGYHSMVGESVGRVPRGWALSPFAHNGYLQVLSDGGLLLGLPFLLAAAAVAALVLCGLATAVRRRDAGLATLAVPVALGCLLLHSAVDFDWTYPANLATTGILAGALLGLRAPRADMPPGDTAPPRPGRAAIVTVLAVATLLPAAWAARHGDLKENLPVHDNPAATTLVKHSPTLSDSH